MTEVFFYHLERSAPEQVLPNLLEKTLKRGWRALVKFPDRESLEAADEALWTYREDSFLPHGTGGEEQPVLLSLEDGAPNGAQAAFLAPGAAMAAEAMAGFERCVLLFTPEGVGAAREQWSVLKKAGLDVTYWQENPDGGWSKKSG